MKFTIGSLPAGAAVVALASMFAGSAAAELPKTLAVTAYDVGSSGYAQAVAIGSAFKNNLGVSLRVLPGKNDVSRTVPLRDKRVDFSFNGIGTFFGQEAVDVFGTKDWGPQAFRVLAMAMGDNCGTAFFAGDIGAKSMADLKGKRVVSVKGSPALNHNTYAYLRFGNLTWDDVEMVEVGGNNGAFDAVLNNQADVFYSVTNSGNILKVMTSPRGITFPVLPHDDEAGWKRLQEVAPYYSKHICKESAGSLEPWEGANYPYPVIINYAEHDAEMAYAMTKAIFEQFDNYKNSAPAATGYALKRQVLDWVVPIHEGAIRYYKEAGRWTPELQAHNDKLVQRQQVLAKLWSEYTATNPAEDKFQDGWMAFRYKGMQEAGFNPIWKTF